jgi:protein SCO1/2
MKHCNQVLCWGFLACAVLFLAACATHPKWALDDITGHMPNLAFHMTNDLGKPVTAHNYRGKIVLLYFGYTHCPDVCPLTLVHLHTVLHKLGKKKAADVQVLFVTVDPTRDTVPVLHQYVTAFDPRFMGLRGTPGQLAQLAKRYRVAYVKEPTQTPGGGYLMTHGAAVYVFGPNGRARLLATPSKTDPNEETQGILHDVKILLRQHA